MNIAIIGLTALLLLIVWLLVDILSTLRTIKIEVRNMQYDSRVCRDHIATLARHFDRLDDE